jgi:hypothetical protein
MAHMRKAAWKPNKGLAIFATVFVVLGVLGAVYLSQDALPGGTRGTVATSTAAGPRVSVLPLALVNDSAVTLITREGKQERLTTDQFKKRVPEKYWPVIGASVATGEETVFHLPEQPAVLGQTSPDGLKIARMGPAKADGAAVLLITEHGNERSQVLRLNSQPVQDAQVHGWFDASHIALSGFSKGERLALAVETNGRVQKLTTIPDTALSIIGRNGGLYYITGQQGEGIESQPVGPSELHRILLTGSDEVLAREADSVIQTLVTGEKGSLAYVRENGDSFVSSSGTSPVSLGRVRPLLFLNEQELLLRNTYKLEVLNIRTGTSTSLGEVPEGAVEAYPLPQLDVYEPTE